MIARGDGTLFQKSASVKNLKIQCVFRCLLLVCQRKASNSHIFFHFCLSILVLITHLLIDLLLGPLLLLHSPPLRCQAHQKVHTCANTQKKHTHIHVQPLFNVNSYRMLQLFQSIPKSHTFVLMVLSFQRVN